MAKDAATDVVLKDAMELERDLGAAVRDVAQQPQCDNTCDLHGPQSRLLLVQARATSLTLRLIVAIYERLEASPGNGFAAMFRAPLAALAGSLPPTIGFLLYLLLKKEGVL